MILFTTSRLVALVSAALSLLSIAAPVQAVPVERAANAKTDMDNMVTAAQKLIDTYYSQEDGIFQGMWWNSAAALTHLADLEAYNPNTTKPTVPDLLANTFKAAGRGGFINSFYDDEGWWALNWIAAYDLTGNKDYLQRAADIWYDMKGGWFNTTGSCGGGIWWNKKAPQHFASISNELFLSVSAHLANRVPDNKTEYVAWAEAEWSWFAQSGMLNVSGGLVMDGFDISTCKPGKLPLSYTQGVIMGGLVELNHAAPSPDLMSNATAIADAVIASSKFNDKNGVFTEPVGGYDNNTAQFKGIFMRNLNILNRHAPNKDYVDFATKNADSVWAHWWENGQIGPV